MLAVSSPDKVAETLSVMAENIRERGGLTEPADLK